MALVDPCLYLQADAHPARSFRAVITEMWDEGLMSLVDFRVTQKAGGANFSVDVSAGRAVVQGDSATLQGHYMVTNDATVNDATTAVTSAPSAGNERYDIVILEVKDNAEDASGLNKPQFRVVAGTPASVGTGTIPATPVSALRLAYIGPIVNSTTSITDSLIHQDNTLAGRRDHVGKVDWLTGNIVPNGWLAADGTAVSRTTYPRLAAHYAAMGYPYGAGNGTTTFNVPDLRGKVAIPAKSGQAQVDTVGETGGDYNLQAHTHTNDHDHPLSNPSSVGIGVGAPLNLNAGFTGGSASAVYVAAPNTAALGLDVPAYTGSTGSTGSGSGQNMPPYQVVALAVIRT